MTRWLVTGAGGMLGQDLTTLLADRGEQYTGLARHDLDITDYARTASVVRAVKPDVVVNCAAWTAVDDAEAHEGAALAVNGLAVAGLAAACVDTRATLVQVSNDYVFDGTATSPYAEAARPSPRSAFGRTKLAGERAVLAILPDAGYVVRAAWLYGAHGANFVHTMIRLARSGACPAVVADQYGQPTWSADVARQIYALVGGGAPAGIYHATSSGQTSWFGLAAEVFALVMAAEPTAPMMVPPAPVPTTMAAGQSPAVRPRYSVLGHDAWAAAGVPPIGHWRHALARAFPAMLNAATARSAVDSSPVSSRPSVALEA